MALAEFRRAGRHQQAATALVNLGVAALYRDDLQLADERLREALGVSRMLGFQEGIAWRFMSFRLSVV